MTPERWALVRQILADAIERPAAARIALLDSRCAGDQPLREEVESLLGAHEAEGFVDRFAPLIDLPGARMDVDWSGREIAHYRVEEGIGHGGMAVVYRARDRRLGRQVALKFLSARLSANARAKTHFVAEARAAAALDHPNVCTIYEIGEADGQLFIAMPLYDGETLQSRLRRGRLTFDEALPVALQVARGLEHAHAAGIVHRDVKPSNIVVLRDGTAKILDFGIAQIHDASLGDSRTLLGTVPYMSPEQARALPVDGRADIWSLAILLHEILTGVRPFQGPDAPAVVRAILDAEPQLTVLSYPDVPSGLERVLQRALAKCADDRYASMSLLLADLAAVGGDRTGAAAGAAPISPMTTTERRRALVLVTVVSDYPALVEQMNPAEAQRLLGRVRDLAVDVMRDYGGLVNQAIGQEIVSLFGVPIAHDDDDVRAIRAALELHTRVRGIEGGALPSAVRVRVQSGLHVGAVVARRLHEGPRRYDVAGAPTALAPLLAAIAGPDEVWITPHVQRLIGPYVHAVPCPAVSLDSHDGPVTPFHVVGETGIGTRLEASTGAELTPYVGRQPELAALREAAAAAGRGAGAIVAVVGEPGAGKSRLLHELREAMQGDPGIRVVRARCRAYADGVPYGVFVQILCEALDVRLPLPEAAAVVERIRALDPAVEPFLPLYLHLLSVSTAQVPRHLQGEHLQAAFLDAAAAFVGAITRRGPVLLLIEDWHWADTGSRAVLGRIAELTAHAPLALVVTSRHEPHTGDGWPAARRVLRLGRLDFAASRMIMQAALGVQEVPEALAVRLDERAGGNPLFLEQLCAALVEERVVAIRDGVATMDAALTLPDTVQGVIRARLDKLTPQALEIVRIASVIGWEFEYAVLAEVVPAHVDLRPAIAAVETAGLIQPIAGGRTLVYRFTHALTQEVCYDSLVAHQRKTLHGAVGRVLAAAWPDGIDERAALLARHFRQAEDWAAAVRFGRRAAERAIALSQFTDALAMLDEVIEWAGRLPDGDPDAIAELLLQQERVCETLGLRARQQQIIDALIAHLGREEGSARLAEVYLRQGDLSTLLKRFDAADRALATALRIGHERGDRTLLRSALRSLGLLRWHEGRHVEAMEITRRVIAVDRECDDELAVAIDLTNLGNILKATGDYAGARARLEEALAMPALHQDPKKLVYTRHNLANVYRAVGDLDRALACLTQNEDITRAHLLPIQRSFHLTSIAHIQLQQGQIDAALTTYRAAVDLSRRARHADGLVQSLRMLGNALFGLARYDEALPCLEEAAELFAQLDDQGSEAEMRSGAARILERTTPAGAADAWTAVLAVHRRRGDVTGELEAREGLARCLRARGPAAAIPAFETALALAATIGERTREAAIRNVLGILEWERGEIAAALRHYEEALALVRRQNHRAHEAIVLNSLGACLIRLNRPDEARTVLEESLAISVELGQTQLEAHALAALGRVALNAQDLHRAGEWFERSRALHAARTDRAGEGWMLLRLAEVRQRLGDGPGALAAASSAAAAAAEAGDDQLRAACAAAAAISHRAGESGDASLHHRAIGSRSHA